MASYARGQLVRCSVQFVNKTSGAAVDPATVSFEYRVGSGSVTTYVYGTNNQLVKDSTGNYHVDLDTSSASGDWYWRFSSTGVNQGAVEGKFTVKPTGF